MSITELHHGPAGRPAAILNRIGAWAGRYLERLSRIDAVRRLEAMSDDELARIGLRRDRIVQHVFRDRIGL